MPKKGKKGGKKGKKGKKGSKKDSKLAVAKSTAKVWDAKLSLIETSRTEFRDAAKRLLEDNDELQRQVHQTEKDTIDVVSFLKKKDTQKDDQVVHLHKSIKEIKGESKKEREQIVSDYQQQVAELSDKLAHRGREMEVIKAELKAVQDFKKRKNQMQRELDEIKDAMIADADDHKGRLGGMEQKFFKEKKRLQQEASQKIAELAEKAHTEAIENLDDSTRSVYKENVRLTEALGYHKREEQKLRAEVERLTKENETLYEEQVTKDGDARSKIAASKKRREELSQLEDKVVLLEAELGNVINRHREDKENILRIQNIEDQSAMVEMDKLRRMMELKSREILKVKKLAKHVLDQRTQIEQWFLESLDFVKQDLIKSKATVRREALQAYQQRIAESSGEISRLPSFKTRTDTDFSSSKITEPEVDVASMSWDQKERVLRMLFVKMNKQLRKEVGLDTQTTFSSFPDQSEEPVDSTFLTQAVLDEDGQITDTADLERAAN